MPKIKLTQGKYAIVSAQDYKQLSQYNWCAIRNRHNWYAVRNVKVAGGRKLYAMHRQILQLPANNVIQVDHHNGNGLDNRRRNLRIAGRTQNQQNCRQPRHNTSGYKGVCWDKNRQQWLVSVTKHSKAHFIGRFNSRRQAAIAYNRAAVKLHGCFARLNKVR